MSRRRWRAMLAGCVSVVVVLAGTAPASAATPTCGKLQGRDLLVGNESLKLVDRRTRSNGRLRHRYVACVEEEDKTRQLTLRASRSGGALTILDSAGAFVVVRDPAGGRVDVWNIPERKRRRLTDAGRNPSGGVVVNAPGDIAAEFGSRLMGFDTGTVRHVLDVGPVARRSLKRSNDSLTWTTSGKRKRGDLRTPALACEALPGERVGTTAEMVVVKGVYGDSLLDSLDEWTRTRVCALPNGPVRVVGESAGNNSLSQGVDIVAGAGHFLVLNNSAGNEDGLDSTLQLFDTAANKRVDLWKGSTTDPDPAPGPGPVPVNDTFERGVVTSAGQVGAAFSGSDDRRIVGFDVAGKARLLDQAPMGQLAESSLGLDGSVVRWVTGAETRTFDLATLASAM